jgi:hypothetical protein
VTSGIVPFHKLSQWLSYSLIDALEQSDIGIDEPDGLTGLPEYRNGGLFLDLGALRLKDESQVEQLHPVDSELVVEWRALTVSLLDRLAPLVRKALGKSDAELPLGKILEGGTWATGRVLAQERRAGLPPLRIDSDGTVF